MQCETLDWTRGQQRGLCGKACHVAKFAIWSLVNSDVTGSVPHDSHAAVLEDVTDREANQFRSGGELCISFTTSLYI